MWNYISTPSSKNTTRWAAEGMFNPCDIYCVLPKYTHGIKCELNVHFALGTYQNHIFVGAKRAQLSRLECFDLAASARLSTLISCGLRTLRSLWLRFLSVWYEFIFQSSSRSLACSRHKLFKMWRIHSVWYELCSSSFLASFFSCIELLMTLKFITSIWFMGQKQFHFVSFLLVMLLAIYFISTLPQWCAPWGSWSWSSVSEFFPLSSMRLQWREHHPHTCELLASDVFNFSYFDCWTISLSLACMLLLCGEPPRNIKMEFRSSKINKQTRNNEEKRINSWEILEHNKNREDSQAIIIHAAHISLKIYALSGRK